MIHPPVSLPELETAMEMLDQQQLKTLLLVFRHKSANETIPMPVLLRLCLYDWMMAVNAADKDSAIRVILQFDEMLDAFAGIFDKNDPGCRKLPWCTVCFTDFIFVSFSGPVPGQDQTIRSKQFYHIKDDKFILALPNHALTLLVCDLGVLMLRFADRIRMIRKQQEKIDADTATLSNRSGQCPQADAGDAG